MIQVKPSKIERESNGEWHNEEKPQAAASCVLSSRNGIRLARWDMNFSQAWIKHGTLESQVTLPAHFIEELSKQK